MPEKKEITLKEIFDELGKNQMVLKEIARWLRFQNIGRLKEILLAELDTEEKKLAFENTNGELGVDDVANISSTPRDTVYGWWKKWFNLGIVEPSGTRKGRLGKICSLEDIGIKPPKLSKGNKENDEKNVTRMDVST